MEKRSWVIVLLAVLFAGGLLACAPFASAHERFVLSASQMERLDRIHDHINIFTSLQNSFQAFIYLVCIVMGIFSLLVFTILSERPWAKRVADYFRAHEAAGIRIVRVVFGFALILASVYQTLFLPDMILTGNMGVLLAYAQIAIGFFIIFNYATDVFAAITFLLYILALFLFGEIALTHIDIAGVALYLLFSHHGQTKWLTNAIDAYEWKKRIAHALARHSYDILRITFGISLVLSGLIYKFLKPEFFMQVVDTFSLSTVFGLQPVFLTLLAGTLEIGLGIILILGIQTRTMAALAVVVFTMMGSLMHEGVTGHFIIYAILILLITHKTKKHEILNLEGTWEKWLDF